VDAALATYCVDISEPKSLRGRMPAYRLYTARWAPAGLEPARRPPATAPDRQPPAESGTPAAPRPSDLKPGEWEIPRVRCSTSGPSSPAWWSARSCAPPSPPRGAGRTTSPRTSRRRCPRAPASPPVMFFAVLQEGRWSPGPA
jgi:hypothetical protein